MYNLNILNGKDIDVIRGVAGDTKRSMVMMYHIALDINYDFGFVETCQTIQTEVRGDMPWHEAVEQEINSWNKKLAGLDYNIELRWVKEYEN